jgi:hypothetical protein
MRASAAASNRAVDAESKTGGDQNAGGDGVEAFPLPT